MARVPIGPALRDVERLFTSGTVAGLTDAELLGRFASRRDEAAFAALVHRHGPMVLGVCRRMLRDPHDADDAFQATFLILARRAGAIRRPELLGNWLYGVARRIALRARSQVSRRRRREIAIETGGDGAAAFESPPGPADRLDLRGVIDEELARLPESQRRPIVLCHLEGLTHEEAAARLNWPVGTVRSRMARGRERLRSRLVSRGMAPASLAGTAALSWPQVAPAALPIALVETTVRAAMLFAATSQAAAVGTLSVGAVALARGILNTMLISKLKVTAAIGLTAVGLAGGGAVVAQQAGYGVRPGATGSAEGTNGSLAVLGSQGQAAGQRSPAQKQIESEIEMLRDQLAHKEALREKLDEDLAKTRRRLADRLDQLKSQVDVLGANRAVAQPSRPLSPRTAPSRVLQGWVVTFNLPDRLVFEPDTPDLVPNPADEVIVYQPQWETMTLMSGPGKPTAAVRRSNHVILARARVESMESGKALCTITEVYPTVERLGRGQRVVRVSDLATVRQGGVLVPDLGSIPLSDVDEAEDRSWYGLLTTIRGDEVEFDRGGPDGVAVGQVHDIWRDEPGKAGTWIGRLKVTDTDATKSSGRIFQRNPDRTEVRSGDFVTLSQGDVPQTATGPEPPPSPASASTTAQVAPKIHAEAIIARSGNIATIGIGLAQGVAIGQDYDVFDRNPTSGGQSDPGWIGKLRITRVFEDTSEGQIFAQMSERPIGKGHFVKRSDGGPFDPLSGHPLDGPQPLPVDPSASPQPSPAALDLLPLAPSTSPQPSPFDTVPSAQPSPADPFAADLRDVTKRLAELEKAIGALQPKPEPASTGLLQENTTGVGGGGLMGMGSGGTPFGGGFGGGMGGIGQGGLARGGMRPGQVPYIQSDQVIVVQPEGLDAVHAYSVPRGSWSTQPLPEQQFGTRVTPIVSGPLAAFTAGKHVFAFSAIVGQWDGIELDAEDIPPTVGRQTVLVEHGGKLHVFSAETGTWSTMDVSKQPETPNNEESSQTPGDEPTQTPVDQGPPQTDSAPPPQTVTIPAQPSVMRHGPLLIITSADGNSITIQNIETNSRATYEAPEGARIVPVFAENVIALQIEGETIRQIAAYTAGQWFTQELRKPTRRASPIVNNNTAVYLIGEDYYVFSAMTSGEKWREFRLGPNTQILSTGLGRIEVLVGDQLHSLDPFRGEWRTIEIAQSGDAKSTEDETPQQAPASSPEESISSPESPPSSSPDEPSS